MQTARRDGIGSDAPHCLTSMATCTPRGSPSVKPPRRLTSPPVPRCKRGAPGSRDAAAGDHGDTGTGGLCLVGMEPVSNSMLLEQTARAPSYSLERVAATRPMREGTPLRALAERIRTPLFAPGRALSALYPVEQAQLKQQAATLTDVFQRSSANVEGRNGSLALRNHALRGLDNPRKRVCLTTVHNVLLTRPDGTTAAERFFGQKPRSMCTAILGAVDMPPAPLSPPRRAVGQDQRG